MSKSEENGLQKTEPTVCENYKKYLKIVEKNHALCYNKTIGKIF